ncbi:MAG: ATP-binding protein [Armatimonadetes bacterium]|nr:ATP-binding protein [Armatimonadota bacterium]
MGFLQANKPVASRSSTGRREQIGAYLAKQLVETHGGELWVQRHEGAGTTFSIRLPRWPPSRGRS